MVPRVAAARRASERRIRIVAEFPDGIAVGREYDRSRVLRNGLHEYPEGGAIAFPSYQGGNTFPEWQFLLWPGNRTISADDQSIIGSIRERALRVLSRQALFEVSAELVSSNAPEFNLMNLISRLVASVGASWASVIYFRSPALPALLWSSRSDRFFSDIDRIRQTGITRSVIRSGEPRCFTDVRAHDRDHPGQLNPIIRDDPTVVAAACVPLRIRGRAAGAMWIHYPDARSFSATLVQNRLLSREHIAGLDGAPKEERPPYT